jgi:hypothetical protein
LRGLGRARARCARVTAPVLAAVRATLARRVAERLAGVGRDAAPAHGTRAAAVRQAAPVVAEKAR